MLPPIDSTTSADFSFPALIIVEQFTLLKTEYILNWIK